LRSLAEAQATSDGVVVFEGDYGGQIYLTCPASMVRCDESSLQTLLTDIDTLAFRDPPSARIYYERHAVSTGIWGGMGGGIVTGSLWVHPRLEAEHPKIVAGVSEVLAARRARLSLAAG
jgi:hypothetical protein